MAERTPRGKYARLICRGCRSRKIKCVLPSTHDLGPLNTPQPLDKSCARCRNLNLECVVDYTPLGRPHSKRNQLKRSEGRSPNARSSSAPEDSPVISSLDIKDYLFADEGDEILSKGSDQQPDRARILRKEKIFQSMIQPNFFFISVLAKDRAFGADVVHATSSWNTPLQDLVSHEMAISFDKCLVWHRFFLPNLPTLVDLRNRLCSDDSISTNCATRLLFALLTLAAFELNEKIPREDWRLKRQLQLAISFFGQEFMFSPPTHRDSVIVSHYLSDYKPAALATMQGVAHKTIKSEIYINIAYGVFHRLEAVSGEGNQDLTGMDSPNYHEFEKCLFNSIEGFQMTYSHASVDGPMRKPLQTLQNVTDYMRTRVEAYQNALKSRQCTPRAIYHIQWAMSTYICFQSLLDVKKSLDEPGALIRITEEAEEKCLSQIYTNSLLEASQYERSEELSVVRSLLELRFSTVLNWIIGGGILYSSSLGARSRRGHDDTTTRNSDISCEDTINLSNQVVGIWNGPPGESNDPLKKYLHRFSPTYTSQLSSILEQFIECSKMKLSGIPFRPPPRYICLENVTFCKNVVENNIIQIKSFGCLHRDFLKQIELFRKCAEQLESMASSPSLSVDAAFAGGCVYAMSSKIVFGFLGLMEKLQKDFSAGAGNTELVDAIIASADYHGLPGVDLDSISDNINIWPSAESFDQLDVLPDSLDWSSVLNLSGSEFDMENNYWLNGESVA